MRNEKHSSEERAKNLINQTKKNGNQKQRPVKQKRIGNKKKGLSRFLRKPKKRKQKKRTLKAKKMDLKNLDLSESLENKEIFGLQSIEAQRLDLLELTSFLIDTSMNIISNCELLENKIEDIEDPQLLESDLNFTNDFNSLGYGVTNLLKKYARFNSFMDVYLTNKKEKQ